MEYITSAVTILTVVGSLANVMKKQWCFYVWGFTNLFWAIYNLFIQEYGQAFIYAVNFGVCIFGIYQWRKKEIKNNDERFN